MPELSFRSNTTYVGLKRVRRVLPIVIACFSLSADDHHGRHDYSLGIPRIWDYARIYPFLDGLFQDAASTAVKAQQLDAAGINASALDAVQNSFQSGAQFQRVHWLPAIPSSISKMP